MIAKYSSDVTDRCHIGAGASWFVRSKLSGVGHVFAVTFNTYPRPIPSPVHNLRPARETCETCHWPQKYSEDKLRIFPKYAEVQSCAVQVIQAAELGICHYLAQLMHGCVIFECVPYHEHGASGLRSMGEFSCIFSRNGHGLLDKDMPPSGNGGHRYVQMSRGWRGDNNSINFR